MSEYRRMMDWLNRPPEKVEQDEKYLEVLQGAYRTLLCLENEAFMAGIREQLKDDPDFRAELRSRLGPIDNNIWRAIAVLEAILRRIGMPRTFNRAAANLKEILGEIQ